MTRMARMMVTHNRPRRILLQMIPTTTRGVRVRTCKRHGAIRTPFSPRGTRISWNGLRPYTGRTSRAGHTRVERHRRTDSGQNRSDSLRTEYTPQTHDLGLLAYFYMPQNTTQRISPNLSLQKIRLFFLLSFSRL